MFELDNHFSTMNFEKQACYQILGLPADSPASEIISKYKLLALRWYPDEHNHSPFAIQNFRDITAATLTLLYPEKNLAKHMTLTEMLSLFQHIFFGNEGCFDDDEEDEDDEDFFCDYDDDDAYTEYNDSDDEKTKEKDKKNLQANKHAQELIQEEERNKKKLEKRKAKKKKQKEKKKQQKEQEIRSEKEKPVISNNFSNTGKKNEYKESQSDVEEDIDTDSAFIAVIKKKHKSIPIIEGKKPENKKMSPFSTPEKIPEDSTSRILRSRQLAIRGNEMASTGHFAEAADLFTKSIKLDPTDHRFYGNRSYCFERLGNFDKALNDAEKSITLSPNWPKGYFRKGRALIGLKKYAEAEICFAQVLKLDNDCEDALKELHKVKINQIKEAGFSVEEAERAIAQYSSVEEALNSLFLGSISKIKIKDDCDIFLSDDESETFWSSLSKPNTSPFEYDVKMDPNNPEGHQSIWIGNVQPDVTEKKLANMFSKYGELISVRIIPERFCAFVNYKNKQSPGKAMLALQGYHLNGANLVIRFPNLLGESKATKKKAGVSAQSKQHPPINGDECYFWRTTGCIYGDKCHYKHVREHKGIDKKPWHIVSNV